MPNFQNTEKMITWMGVPRLSPSQGFVVRSMHTFKPALKFFPGRKAKDIFLSVGIVSVWYSNEVFGVGRHYKLLVTSLQ